jgi:transposase
MQGHDKPIQANCNAPGQGPDCSERRESDKRLPVTGPVRSLKPQREGVVRVPCALDEMVPADHVVRDIWAVLETLDVSAFEADLRARESHPGRPPIDRRILIALWVYAVSEGVHEARELDRLCRMHLAYLWICGGVSVDYHVLSDFRVGHDAALEELMSQVLQKLKERGQVELQRTSQDGMRVRASAGAASFHREATLQRHLEQARQEEQTLLQQQKSQGAA